MYKGKKVMDILNKIIRVLTDKNARFGALARRGFYNHMPDDAYLRKIFKMRTGYDLNLDNPRTFNEKIQWLKLHDRKDIYTTFVDKFEAKKYIANKIGENYIIPTIGVWDNFDEINFEQLPQQFVLKCTHDSGGVIICDDKSKLDLIVARKKIENSLSRNYFWAGREWPYKNIKPRIIAEEYMIDKASETNGITDYKLMCFNGKVRCSFTCTERFSTDGLKVTFFDNDWNIMPFARHYPVSKKKINKPENFKNMIEIAEQLAEDMCFIRVDFYEISGKLYIGELTLYPGSGFEEFEPTEWDYQMGAWLDISSVI